MSRLLVTFLVAGLLGFGVYKGYSRYQYSRCLTDEQARFQTLLEEIMVGEQQCDALDDLKQEQTNCLTALKNKVTKDIDDATAEFEKRGCPVNE